MTLSSYVEAIATYEGPDGGWARARELCHDLRQPLAAILIMSSSLAGSEVEGGVHDALVRIQEQTSVLVDMVRGALDQTTGPQPLVVGALVEDVVEVERITWPGRLEYVPPADDSFDVTVAEATKIRRAVANLIENAARAAGSEGRVRVSVVAGDWVEVDVEDDGPGFGAVPSGTGLGLGIVRATAAELGGTVELGVSRLGGVEARLRLPVMGADHLGVAS